MFQEDPPASVTSPPVEDGPPWRGRDLALGTLLVAGPFVVLAALALAIGGGGAAPEVERGASLAGVIITLLVEVWMGAVVLVLARRRGMSLRDLGFRRPRDWGLVPYAVIGAYLAIGGYQLLLAGLEALSGRDLSSLGEGNQIPAFNDESTLIRLGIVLAVGVAAPFSEELFFRGLVFPTIGRIYGVAAGLAVSGLAFSLVHLNPSVIVPFAVIGVIFAWAFRASGSLWTTISAHAIVNGVGLIATLMGVER